MQITTVSAVITLLTFLEILIKTNADGESCEKLHKPVDCSSEGDKRSNYTLNVHCLNENQVSVSFEPIKGDDLELVTMQYTCFDPEQQTNSTIVYESESEELSKTLNRTNDLLSKGYCVFTGCTKKGRKKCWQHMTAVTVVNITCAPITEKAPSLSPSSSISSSPSPQSHFTLSPLPSASQIIGMEVPTSTSNERSTSSINDTLSAATTVTTSTRKDENPTDSIIIVPVSTTVALSIVGVISLFALILSFMACRRFNRRAESTSSIYPDLEARQDMNENVYMMNNLVNGDKISTKGSILTIVQSLHNHDADDFFLKKSNLTNDLHGAAIASPFIDEITKREREMFLLNDSTNICKSSLTGSCLSLPESINSNGNHSLQKEEIHYSSQTFQNTNHYVRFSYPKLETDIVNLSSNTEIDSRSLPSENEVFTDTELEDIISRVNNITHFSTSSSGYVSTSPIHEHSINEHDDYNNSYDHGYIANDHYENEWERETTDPIIVQCYNESC